MMGEVIRVSGRAPDVGDLLREAMVSQRFADVALCCSGGQRFLAHRLVLSAASPYLQDVLLSHGKVAGFSEPITIILAEVEGPELSAILGFVYTGSATIPKSRLEAFRRAAATLRVTIPSFSSSSSSGFAIDETPSSYRCEDNDDSNLDNVKIEETTRIEEKIYNNNNNNNNNNNAMLYDRCEQYPSYDGWFDSSGWHFSADCTTRRYYRPDDWIIRTRNDAALSRPSTRHPSREDVAKFHSVAAGSVDAGKSGESLLDEERKIRRIDYRDENNIRTCRYDHDDRGDDNESRKHPGEAKRFSRPSEEWENPLRVRSSYDSLEATTFQDRREERRNYVYPSLLEFQPELGNVDDRKPVDSYFTSGNIASRSEKDDEGGRNKRSKRVDDDFEGGREKGREMAPSLFSYSSATAGSSVQDYVYAPTTASAPSISYDDNCPSRALILGTRNTSETGLTSSTVTSDITGNFAPSPTALVRTSGDDLCSESCCKWRTTPRRHVANRVPASPWCQLARPAHHSPKTRPVILRDREEESLEAPSTDNWNNSIKLGEHLTNLHAATSTAYIDNKMENSSSLSSHADVKNDPSGSIYGYQVPRPTENPSSLEGTLNYTREPRSPIYYEEKSDNNSSVLSGTSISSLKQFPSVIKSNEILRSMEKPPTIQDNAQDSSQLLRHIDRASNIVVNHEQSRVKLSQHAASPEATTNKQIINDPSTCNLKVSSRIELSHPISRLCDSIRKTDQSISRDAFFVGKNLQKSTVINNASTTTTREIPTKNESTNFHGKTIFSLSGGIVQSDDNNNEAELDESAIDNVINVDGNNVRIDGEDESINSEEHKCDQCSKTFVTRASLKVHGRTHSGEKPFRCNDCGKEFSQLRNYKYHRSVHEGTREFAATCPECGKYFNDRGYLSSHMKIHRNRKEYGCTECGKSFNQRVAYNMHVRIHTGIKPHQCEQCGKAFSRKMLLKQHLRTHSGERPYQCQICHKAFADRSNMTLHTRLHSGLKPYQCTLCSKAFTKKHHLKTHLNYHTGTKPYSCPNCSLRFSQSSNMRTHYKKCCSVEADSSKRGNPRGRSREESTAPSSDSQAVTIMAAAPSVGAGRTNALTPPNSDQESSINTPIKINDVTLHSHSRGINSNKDSTNVSDT